MGKYLDRAKELRADSQVHYNCAQAALLPFASLGGMSEEQAFAIAANFGGGMKMGSVCGAVTGGLMALGLAGIDSPAAANEFCRRIRDRHEGCLMCRDLLRMNMERGGEKKPHCDGMVFESVALVEEMLDRVGKNGDSEI